jgi:hypothetical protein
MQACQTGSEREIFTTKRSQEATCLTASTVMVRQTASTVMVRQKSEQAKRGLPAPWRDIDLSDLYTLIYQFIP